MSPILYLPRNDKGRDFVVGDIHGCYRMLDNALASVDFDPEKDRLISVGDLVNRGPESAECLHYLAQPWFFAIKGNHEVLFTRLYKDGNFNEEGMKNLAQQRVEWMRDLPTETLDDIRHAFQNLPVIIEMETDIGKVGFVHADIPQGMDWETLKNLVSNGDRLVTKFALTSHRRVWEGIVEDIAGIDRIFLGHTPVEDVPVILGNCIFIDTGGVFKLIGEHRSENVFLTIAEVKAPIAAFATPEPTVDPLVRKVSPPSFNP